MPFAISLTQGLATQGGTQVVMHFKNEGANRVATEIEIQADEEKWAHRDIKEVTS